MTKPLNSERDAFKLALQYLHTLKTQPKPSR